MSCGRVFVFYSDSYRLVLNCITVYNAIIGEIAYDTTALINFDILLMFQAGSIPLCATGVGVIFNGLTLQRGGSKKWVITISPVVVLFIC